MDYRIGSVCSGIGGLELGLERAGVGSVVWQCEVDAFCRSVLAKHWPTVQRFVHVQSLCRTVTPPAVDVICGGFPCQDLSVAGRRAGLVEGVKSSLFFEVARVVAALSPRFVVLENVAGVLGPSYDLLVGTMAAIGYHLWWDCVPAAAVGAPHLRDRWFAIGWLANANREQGHPGVSLTDAVRGDGGRGRLWPTPLASDGRRSGDGDTREGGPSLTEVAAVPSPVEAWERGVPRLCGSDPLRDARLEALGNAVSPVVSEVIGRVLLDLDADLRGPR